MSSFEEIAESLKSFHKSCLSQKDLQISQLLFEKLQQENRQKRSERQILKLAKQINSLKQKLMSFGQKSSEKPESVLVEKLTVENHLLFKKIGAEREAFESRISQLRMEFENGAVMGDSYFDKELVDPGILRLDRGGRVDQIHGQGIEDKSVIVGQELDRKDENEILSSQFSVDLSSNPPPSQDVFKEENLEDNADIPDFSEVSHTPHSSKPIGGLKCHSDPMVKKRIVQGGDGPVSVKDLKISSSIAAKYSEPEAVKREDGSTDPVIKKNPSEQEFKTSTEVISSMKTPKHGLPPSKAKIVYSKTPIPRVKPRSEQKQTGVADEQELYEEVIPNSEVRQANQQNVDQNPVALKSLSPNKPESKFKRKRDVKCLSDPEIFSAEDEVKPIAVRTLPSAKSKLLQNTRTSMPPKAIYSKTPITLTPTPTPTFAYNHVTRDKQSRQQMHGDDCPCCSEYYKLTKDLPRLNNTGAKAVQEVSRHRAWFKRPSTPPGFWDVHMASTQEIEDKQRLQEQESGNSMN